MGAGTAAPARRTPQRAERVPMSGDRGSEIDRLGSSSWDRRRREQGQRQLRRNRFDLGQQSSAARRTPARPASGSGGRDRVVLDRHRSEHELVSAPLHRCERTSARAGRRPGRGGSPRTAWVALSDTTTSAPPGPKISCLAERAVALVDEQHEQVEIAGNERHDPAAAREDPPRRREHVVPKPIAHRQMLAASLIRMSLPAHDTVRTSRTGSATLLGGGIVGESLEPAADLAHPDRPGRARPRHAPGRAALVRDRHRGPLHPNASEVPCDADGRPAPVGRGGRSRRPSCAPRRSKEPARRVGRGRRGGRSCGLGFGG